MDVMEENITAFINKHQLLQKDRTVLVGVSGGPDSMALLHFYTTIKEEWNLTIVAIVADHQLRGEQSAKELQYVKNKCEKWGIQFVGRTIDVKAYEKEHQVSTQVASRETRYQFYKEMMHAYEANYLALGHHGDDQVETMLMGFVRTSSPVALSGIPVKRKFASGYIVRPLLCVNKAMIMDYCKENNIHPKIDPSNKDMKYARNYYRKQIIPLIKEQNHSIHQTAQRLSEALQMDEQFLQDEAEKVFYNIIHKDEKQNQVSFNITEYKSYPHALQRRTYHLILNYLYEKLPTTLSHAHEASFFSLLGDKKGNVVIDFPNKLIIEKSYDSILFNFLTDITKASFSETTLSIPGKIQLQDGTTLTSIYTDNYHNEDINTFTLTSEISLPLHIRTRKPGDRMSWSGLDGSKKIKDIFIDEKIPRRKRDNWPIVTDNEGEIIWLVGLRKGKLNNEIKCEEESYIQLIYEEKNSPGGHYAKRH